MYILIGFMFFSLVIVVVVWMFIVWCGFIQDWFFEEFKIVWVVLVEKNLWIDVLFFVVGCFDCVYCLFIG